MFVQVRAWRNDGMTIRGIVPGMDVDSIVSELESAAEVLAAHDERRAALLADRDAAILRAREAGVSWKRIGEATGLSVRAIAKALERVSAGSDVD